MKEIPILKAEQVECRVAQTTEKNGKKRYKLLLYKTARTDREILDDVFGKMNWKSTYYRDSEGVLFCRISIWNNELAEWIDREDCGIEGKGTEDSKIKGEASDAFKRAGFAWGIGVELYTPINIWVEADTNYPTFDVTKFVADKDTRTITELEISVDGKQAFKWKNGKGGAVKQKEDKTVKEELITDRQYATIMQIIDNDKINKYLEYYKLNDLREMTKALATKIIDKNTPKDTEKEDLGDIPFGKDTFAMLGD